MMVSPEKTQYREDTALLITRLTEANAEAAELVAELEESKERLERSNQNLAAANARSAELLAELQDRREELEWSNANLKKAFEDNKRLLGVAAHDIRSGIGAIAATSELLCLSLGAAEGESPGEAELIHKESRRLLVFLEDLLEKSCAELGQIKIRPVKCDLAEIVTESMSAFENLAAKKRQRMELEHGEGAAVVFADPIRARQVVDNLLSNAIKFSPAGARITIGMRTRDGLVHVTVDDEGPGLTAEDLENVFREFAAMSAKPTADEQSHGLGLSIVKRIVVLHGGNAWAENRKDRQGARFCFTMPVPAESVRKCRILAVDDQALNRQVIKRLLSQAGHEVETRGSGAEAIEAIRQGEFDMVFLDVEMPGISGLEATKRIREAGYGVEQLPIIAVTGHGDALHCSLCLDSGMNETVQKPVNAGVLEQMVAKWAPRRS
jgi:signal transduction histidine kinase